MKFTVFEFGSVYAMEFFFVDHLWYFIHGFPLFDKLRLETSIEFEELLFACLQCIKTTDIKTVE
jgi:hypothetical protein